MKASRINMYRAAVVASLKSMLPELRSCEEQFGRFDLDELEHNTIPAPAVRFAVVEANVKSVASGEAEAELRCAAFVITEGKDRNQVGWTIGEAIAVAAHSSQRWGLFSIGAPSAVKLAPVISANVKSKGVVITAVEWRQDLHKLGEGIFDEAGHLLEELYVNGELVDVTPEAGNA